MPTHATHTARPVTIAGATTRHAGRTSANAVRKTARLNVTAQTFAQYTKGYQLSDTQPSTVLNAMKIPIGAEYVAADGVDVPHVSWFADVIDVSALGMAEQRTYLGFRLK